MAIIFMGERKPIRKYKDPKYETWDRNNYWVDTRFKIWMSRNSEAHLLCLGYWTMVIGGLGPLENIKFTAADPHWISINMTTAGYTEQDRQDFKDYMDAHSIKWL